MDSQRLMVTHLKVWNNYWKGNGNKALNFWWNRPSTLIVSSDFGGIPITHIFTRKFEFKKKNFIFCFAVASLLSCLHQLRSENIRLEEHVNNLVARRDHLLAVNARLAIPLNQVPPGPNQNSGMNHLIESIEIHRKWLKHFWFQFLFQEHSIVCIWMVQPNQRHVHVLNTSNSYSVSCAKPSAQIPIIIMRHLHRNIETNLLCNFQ